MSPALIIRELSLPDSPPEPNPAGEALYAQRVAASIASMEPGERDPSSLEDCIRFIETWLADSAPANDQGQISFTRALCEAALDSMKAELARQAARDNDILTGR